MLMAPEDIYVHDIPQYETAGQKTTTVLLFLETHQQWG